MTNSINYRLNGSIEIQKKKVNGKTQFQVSPIEVTLERALSEIKKKFNTKADLYYLSMSPDSKYYSIGYKSSAK